MLSSALSLVPTKYLVPTALLASANKRVIFPAAKKIASKVSTGLGILTEDEAWAQEKMFDSLMFPINNIIDKLEQEVIDILGGTGMVDTLSGWFGNKKKYAPTEIVEKEDASVKT